MAQTHIINPLTRRSIAVGKSTYRKVIKLKNNIEELQKISRKQTQDINKKQKKSQTISIKVGYRTVAERC